MEKYKLCIVCLIFGIANCTAAPEVKSDSLNKQTNTIKIMPIIGYDFLTNGFGKIGTWIEFKKQFWGEAGYSFFYNNPSNNQTEFYSYTQNKFLLGANIFLTKKEDVFFNFSAIRIFSVSHTIYHDSKLSYNRYEYDNRGDIFNSKYRYSFNVGYKRKFISNNNNFGMLIKGGLLYKPIIHPYLILPFNFELSFYYCF